MSRQAGRSRRERLCFCTGRHDMKTSNGNVGGEGGWWRVKSEEWRVDGG